MSRALAIDIGTVRIGIAMSDESRMIASPFRTIEARPTNKAIASIGTILLEHDIQQIIFGLPLELDGTEGRASKRTRKLIAALEATTDVPCEPWDERMTSVVAERTLIEADMSRKKRKKVVDQLAATLILQSWLDSQSRRR